MDGANLRATPRSGLEALSSIAWRLSPGLPISQRPRAVAKTIDLHSPRLSRLILLRRPRLAPLQPRHRRIRPNLRTLRRNRHSLRPLARRNKKNSQRLVHTISQSPSSRALEQKTKERNLKLLQLLRKRRKNRRTLTTRRSYSNPPRLPGPLPHHPLGRPRRMPGRPPRRHRPHSLNRVDQLPKRDPCQHNTNNSQKLPSEIRIAGHNAAV